MRSNERHKYGAHFTNEQDMMRVITPTIIRPWKEKIAKAKTIDELKDVRRQMGEYRVLDPACGCGNFLFVAYREMKELECQVIDRLFEFPSTNNKTFPFGSVISTKQFFGIDVQSMAVELAKMTMMIAKELCEFNYQKRISKHGSSFNFDSTLPLDNMDNNILCQDALL
jgi:type I restriction-modification system DNA methylase subunit